ncbi:tumor protein p53-inducible protein 13 [Plakobranchus ocellatus]|uniref:Tumor protein p53-inducible protein 13 n=1 Tax=Plakobranchus ocellatus TaxID=259542 RepID=A0AAV3YR23_9GAST|nr:tumor protein p53-inducible protein 13 [Plakobranchus ocellatus]
MFLFLPSFEGVGGTVARESALRSAGTLLSRVRAPPPAPWPDGGPESLRSSYYLRHSAWFMSTMAVWYFLIAAVVASLSHVSGADNRHSTPASDDPHGGVPMGIPNKVCDNGTIHIEVDWDPKSTEEYTCLEPRIQPAQKDFHYYHCDDVAQRPIHKCLPTPLNYTDDLPTSGQHRPLWPVYGEYTYVPPQRWLHSLEHGGIVFLYHPCADQIEIEKFKSLARGCLRRHVISAYKKLPPEMNFAVLAWKCKLVLSDVNIGLITRFVKARALKGSEAVAADGQYTAGLIHRAELVTDYQESEVCPQVTDLTDPMRHVLTASSKRRSHHQAAENRLRKQMSRLLDLYQGRSNAWN